MLKKTLKKLIATALAVATVATTMVAPVSASTLTPKKSHSKAQITEFVDYYNEITDRYTFRPDGYIPTTMGFDHDSNVYRSWQMTQLLQNTPGITSEQKEDMKTAAEKWKKSYMSGRMLYVYQSKWSYKMYDYFEHEGDRSSKIWASKYKNKAKQTYTYINNYLSKYSRLNPKLAGELKKFNKQRLDIYNKAIDNWYFKMSSKQKMKYCGTIVGGGEGENTKPHPSFRHYIDCMFSKSKMSADPWACTPFGESCTKHIAVDDYFDTKLYRSDTLGLDGNDLNPNGPSNVWGRHMQWWKW